jgi:hypothetical protein
LRSLRGSGPGFRPTAPAHVDDDTPADGDDASALIPRRADLTDAASGFVQVIE